MFLSDCINLLEYSHLLGGKLDTGGNLNVHFDRPTDPSAAKMLDVIQLFGLSRAVEATTLDPLIYRADDRVFRSVLSAPHRVLRSRARGATRTSPSLSAVPCSKLPGIFAAVTSLSSGQTSLRSTSSQHPSAVDDFNSQLRSVPT